VLKKNCSLVLPHARDMQRKHEMMMQRSMKMILLDSLTAVCRSGISV